MILMNKESDRVGLYLRLSRDDGDKAESDSIKDLKVVAFSVELGLAFFADRNGAVSAGPEQKIKQIHMDSPDKGYRRNDIKLYFTLIFLYAYKNQQF